MSYASQTDLEKRGLTQTDLQQLADDPDDLTLTPAEIVTAALIDADALIDGYLGKRYTVPFNPIPPLVTKLSADIAAYHLYAHRAQVETPRIVEDRYRDAISMLKMLVTGEMTLYLETVSAAGSSAAFDATPRIFTRDTMRNMR